MIKQISGDTAAPYEIAVVGLGRAGWNQHFLPLGEHSSFRLTGAVDPLAERRDEAAAQAPGCRVYDSLEALLADQRPDLVVVATPNEAHFEDASRVLNAGCHCILEKPMTTNAADAAALVDLSEQVGRELFIHQQHAFGGEAALLSQFYQSGELGRWFQIRTLWGGFNRRRDWQTLRKNGGGQLNNTFPHIMSVIAQFLPGPFEISYATLRTIKDAGDAEDHLHVILKNTDGLVLDIIATTCAAQTEPRWQIYGSKGALMISTSGATLRYHEGEEGPTGAVIDGAAPSRLYNLETLDWQERHFAAPLPASEAFYDHVCAVLRGDAPMKLTARASAEVIALMEEIRLANFANAL